MKSQQCFVFCWLIAMLLNVPHAKSETSNPDWNCQKSADSNEWVCVTRTKKTTAKVTKEETTIKKTISELMPQKSTPTPPKIARKPGWTCMAGDTTAPDWNCTLVGPDPQGIAQAVPETVAKEQTTTSFTPRNEQLFQKMIELIPKDPWGICSRQLGPPLTISESSVGQLDLMVGDADYAEIEDQEIATFVGNVDLTHETQRIRANYATYDTVSDTLNAKGSVYYREQDISVYSDSVFLKLGEGQGRLRNSLYIFETVPARAVARVAYRDSDIFSRYHDVAYTSCGPGNTDWTLEAKYLTINKEEGRGTARSAWLEFKGIPFLYTPYLSFPIDDRRKSGFLGPSIGSSNESGFTATVPYYWNIAPNYDATFFPQLLTQRGLLLGGEFRYLTDRTTGEISAELIPFDKKKNEPRGQISILNRTQFRPDLSANIDINFVSDDDYLDQIGNTLSFSNKRHVRSVANLNYGIRNLSALLRVENYQTIDEAIVSEDKPYRRLPQLLINMNKQLGKSLGNVAFRNEFVFFQRDKTVTSKRIDLMPSFSLPIRTAATFINPSISLRHTRYWLDGQARAITSKEISRTLPIVSLDSGVTLERDWNFGDTSYIQTLEPRLYYLFVPNTSQNNIPIFDTAENDFTFSQLFRNNRFSGADRIGDANQVTVAFSSRLLEPKSGKERLKASLGQIFYFRDRDVTLPDEQPETNRTSNLISELNAQITSNWSLRSGIQWSPSDKSFERGQALLQYLDADQRIFNLGYRFRDSSEDEQDTLINQINTSIRWPFATDWNVVGRWQYSFRRQLTVESFFGFEKESCCWRFRIVGRRYVNDEDSDANNAIFIQLELKGLTGFGNQVDKFLEKSIRGYKIPK